MPRVPVALAMALLAVTAEVASAGQGPSVEIVSPKADAVVIGTTRLEAVLTSSVRADRVAFFVDGRTVCTPTAPPYACTFDAGGAAREHHIRVVAYLDDGGRAAAERLVAEGLLVRSDPYLALSLRGRLLADAVARQLTP